MTFQHTTVHFHITRNSYKQISFQRDYRGSSSPKVIFVIFVCIRLSWFLGIHRLLSAEESQLKVEFSTFHMRVDFGLVVVQHKLCYFAEYFGSVSVGNEVRSKLIEIDSFASGFQLLFLQSSAIDTPRPVL